MKSYKEVYSMVNGLQKKAADQTKPITAPQNKGYIEQITGGNIPLTSSGDTLQGDVTLKDARQAQANQVSGIYPSRADGGPYMSTHELRARRAQATATLNRIGKFKQSLSPQQLKNFQDALKTKNFLKVRSIISRNIKTPDFYPGSRRLHESGAISLMLDLKQLFLDTQRNPKAEKQLWFKLRNQANTNSTKKLPIV